MQRPRRETGRAGDSGPQARRSGPCPRPQPSPRAHHGCAGRCHRAAPRGCRAGAHLTDEGTQGLVRQALLRPTVGDQVPVGGQLSDAQRGEGRGGQGQGMCPPSCRARGGDGAFGDRGMEDRVQGHYCQAVGAGLAQTLIPDPRPLIHTLSPTQGRGHSPSLQSGHDHPEALVWTRGDLVGTSLCSLNQPQPRLLMNK